MAGVRDPQFWKRFSTAVHLDEEAGPHKPGVPEQDGWLARQNRKKSGRTWVCWLFWFLFAAIVGGGIIAVIWVLQSGALDHVKIGNGDGTPDGTNNTLDPNGNTEVTPPGRRWAW